MTKPSWRARSRRPCRSTRPARREAMGWKREDGIDGPSCSDLFGIRGADSTHHGE